MAGKAALIEPSGTLTKAEQGKLDAHAAAIDKARTALNRSVIEIGRHLAAAQELLSRDRTGTFGKWLAEIGFGKSTAFNYIAAFKTFGNCPKFGQFDDSAMYLLSAPSVPEEATERAIELAESGERITHARAKELLEEFGISPTKDDGSPWPICEALEKLNDAVRRVCQRWPEDHLETMAHKLRTLADGILKNGRLPE